MPDMVARLPCKASHRNLEETSHEPGSRGDAGAGWPVTPIRAELARFYEAEEAYMAAEAPDFAPVAATLHPDCLIRQPDTLPYGGAWRGHAGFEAWMRSFRTAWSALSVCDPRVFATEDEAVIFSRSHVHATARATGRRTDWPLLQQIELRGGLILTLQPFHWDTAGMLSALSGKG